MAGKHYRIQKLRARGKLYSLFMWEVNDEENSILTLTPGAFTTGQLIYLLCPETTQVKVV